MKIILQWSFLALMVAASASASRPFPGPLGSDPWQNRPDDPDYEDSWHLFSHAPEGHLGALSEEERRIGSGMSVDKAWQLHTGTPSTLIALIDSGVYWDSYEIRDRVYINTAEVPKPKGCQNYDCNGDGRVSISDYENDPRVSDRNHNDAIDVGDLILAFSDGRDDDANGFVDDISGWDFHEHDNDPGDRVEFGHGTGEAKDSVGQVNNGYGTAGGCPNCTVVFLRANDSFVVDANAFAASVHYGVDRGAAVVQEALGALNHNDATQEAVNYAWRHNAIIIGSAADENSYHHNYPATLDPVIYVNALRYDTMKSKEATSFLAFNNCSNLGARVDVAASGISCSSEAVGNLSGIAALASSYAKSLGKPLSAGELSALIKNTATDVNLGSNAAQPNRFSTWSGWDRVSGYGRVNAFEILTAIAKDKIPPSSRIVGPKWFELYREGRDSKIPVFIETGVPRSGTIRAKLEVTRGVDTAQSSWVTLKDSGKGSTLLDGLFRDVAISELTSLPKNTLDGPEYRHAFTFRLTADNLAGQTSESRRTVFIYRDDRLASAYPKDMGASGESAGLFADLNHDGAEEFVTADGAGYVHAWTASGRELSGFPVQATSVSAYAQSSRANFTGGSVYAPIAAADLDGDGDIEIVAASMEGDVSVILANGRLAKGSPFKLPFPDMTRATKSQVIAQGVFAAPVLADLDKDTLLDIIITSADGFIYAFSMNGTPKHGYPVAVARGQLQAKLMSSPAVYDVNADGIPDLILGSNHLGREAGYLFAMDGRGNRAPKQILAGFPVQIPLIRDGLLPTVGSGIPTSPIVADLDNDRTKEILVHGFVGKPYIVTLNGGLKKSLSIDINPPTNLGETSLVTGFGHPSVASLDGTGQLSPVVLATSNKMLVSMANGGQRIAYNHFVGAWDMLTGRLRPGFPRYLDDLPLITSSVSADLDGDGKDEIIVGTGGYDMHVFSNSGELSGFPAFTGGWILGSPTVGDIDGDGALDIAATTREGYVFIWKTNIPRSHKFKTWPTFKGNNARTGVQGDSQ